MEGTGNIQDLLPHRDPFLFVDEIVSVSEKEIIAVKTFKANDRLFKDGFSDCNTVPEAIILESMAQCGGAGMRLLGVSKGVFALVQIETVQVYKAVAFDEQVKYVIANLRMSEKIIRQSGIAYVNDTIIMEASWMSIRIG
jgi:3-hydroxyacyl-[acyl-carrier-protein] dehydratase